VGDTLPHSSLYESSDWIVSGRPVAGSSASRSCATATARWPCRRGKPVAKLA